MDTFEVRSERRPGHFWADNEILDVHAPQIGIMGFAVYMAVVRFADNHGVAKPSVATLAKRLGVSENTIRKCLDILKDAGLLRIEQQTRERDGRTLYLSNRYVICSVAKEGDAGYFTTLGTSRGEPPTSRGEPPVNLNNTQRTRPSSKDLKQQQQQQTEALDDGEAAKKAAVILLDKFRKERNGRG